MLIGWTGMAVAGIDPGGAVGAMGGGIEGGGGGIDGVPGNLGDFMFHAGCTSQVSPEWFYMTHR